MRVTELRALKIAGLNVFPVALAQRGNNRARAAGDRAGRPDVLPFVCCREIIFFSRCDNWI